MEVIKVFNNNVVMIQDADGQEAIVMGRGLGFQKKTGDQLDQELVEKVFKLSDQQFSQAVSELYVQLTPKEVDIFQAIISKAAKVLKTQYNESLYLALADHLHFVIDRAQQGLFIKNPLSFEIKKFYQEEYQVGLEAVKLLNESFNLEIPDDEAASIALHFVNAKKNDHEMDQTVKVTKLIQELINLVRRYYRVEFDEESVSYARFVTHLQYFAQRVLDGQAYAEGDSLLYDQVKQNYPKAFACAELIGAYVSKQYHFDISQEELVYLTIHIQRTTTKMD
ncbi:BglG family transcription antiterminator LicT [Streptococcus moroccensis]|uniref:Beta-glucoside operon transcriptional antiterminator n=1 Tax=Streptococcus moroccensis TaxID=1451356 RepID=A0ABT9YQ22_9STRE|nr:PRD domain-containing protein [Streptococcus moroccensis]MDQ0222083.1 beta-glucoside operon transcriptional antiterminator [Streptococcus moroccensis]